MCLLHTVVLSNSNSQYENSKMLPQHFVSEVYKWKGEGSTNWHTVLFYCFEHLFLLILVVKNFVSQPGLGCKKRAKKCHVLFEGRLTSHNTSHFVLAWIIQLIQLCFSYSISRISGLLFSITLSWKCNWHRRSKIIRVLELL